MTVLLSTSSNIFFQEHDEDIPLKEEDIEDIEDEDYIHEDHLKPRDRALPSYIKKEKKLAFLLKMVVGPRQGY